MRTASLRRSTLLLLLVAALAASSASAAGPRSADLGPVRTFEPASPSFVDRVVSLLRSVWSPVGCILDPDGRCSTGTLRPPIPTDEGCNIDPNGHCSTRTRTPRFPIHTEEGCILDPNGQCRP
jgi:hypothetical protein